MRGRLLLSVGEEDDGNERGIGMGGRAYGEHGRRRISIANLQEAKTLTRFRPCCYIATC